MTATPASRPVAPREVATATSAGQASRAGSSLTAGLVLTDRLSIRALQAADVSTLLAYYDRNRDHLRRWEPTRDASFYSRATQARLVQDAQRQARNGEALRYTIRWLADNDRRDAEILGLVSLTGIRRGVHQSAELGFSLDQTVTGKGVMFEAVRAVCRHAFAFLGLHRVEAYVQPDNERSRRLLDRSGFQNEGLMRGALQINGAWRDHRLYARLSTDCNEGSA